MNALQSSFQLISPAISMGPNDACRHRSLHMRMLLRENDAMGVAMFPGADGNLLFLFSLQSNTTKEATVAQGQPRGRKAEKRGENGRNGLTIASEASICCVLFIATGEKDAYPIFREANPVREPARPSRMMLAFSADHGFMAHFALRNQLF